MPIETIKWVKGCARIIDQTKLPNKFEYIYCRDADAMWQAIKRLSVRGAPAIGVAAAFGVLLGIRKFKGRKRADFVKLARDTCDYLATSRPTAVNLFNMLDRMKTVITRHPRAGVDQIKRALHQEAMAIFKEDQQTCRAMGDHGAALIKNGMSALTVCNAGALATVDYGTALGVFYSARS